VQPPAATTQPVELFADPNAVPPHHDGDDENFIGITRWFVKKCGGPEEARRILDSYIALRYGQLIGFSQNAQVMVSVPMGMAGYGRQQMPMQPMQSMQPMQPMQQTAAGPQ
jgi:hypothetical protein